MEQQKPLVTLPAENSAKVNDQPQPLRTARAAIQALNNFVDNINKDLQILAHNYGQLADVAERWSSISNDRTPSS